MGRSKSPGVRGVPGRDLVTTLSTVHLRQKIMDPWASFLLCILYKRHFGENEMKRNTMRDNIKNDI